MKTRLHALGGSFPGFKLFRICQRGIATPQNFSFNFSIETIRSPEFLFVLVKPIQKSTAFFGRKIQDALFKLFHAHAKVYRFWFPL
jgi:hypothetical protein